MLDHETAMQVVDMASGVQGLFLEISEAAFRADISSTELRKQGQALT